ncbi:MAG: hypothetical protein R3Y24_02740 [Eubacteriales bacterium]
MAIGEVEALYLSEFVYSDVSTEKFTNGDSIRVKDVYGKKGNESSRAQENSNKKYESSMKRKNLGK